MMHPLGQTRTSVHRDHAVIAPDSHVISPIHGYDHVDGVMLISPAMASSGGGNATRGPGFAMFVANFTSRSAIGPRDRPVQRLIYVLDGSVTVDGNDLGADSFAYLGCQSTAKLSCNDAARALIFEKPYIAVGATSPPGDRYGRWTQGDGEPFMGDDGARLSKLLPETSEFDMAVNVFTFDPGTPLPLVETHIMEHGLYMSRGAGVYRLADRWYPVAAGDAIWMAAYCPQWFVAMGKTPAQYIYYKDIHRDHLPPSGSDHEN